MKTFKENPYKFILECVVLFVAVSSICLYIAYYYVQNIFRLTFLEFLASLGTGLAAAMLYGIVKSTFVTEKKVEITEKNIVLIKRFRKQKILIENIKSVKTFNTFIYKALNIAKIKIETDRFYSIFLNIDDIGEFIALLPERLRTVELEKSKEFNTKFWLNLACALIQMFMIYIAVSMLLLPAVLDLVAVKSQYLVWKILIAIFLLLLIYFLALYTIKFLRYHGYKYVLNGSKIIITCGGIVQKNYVLNFNEITAISFKHNFITRLLDLYKLKVFTTGSGKGTNETNYFPFMLSYDEAYSLISSLVGDKVAKTSLNKTILKSIIPSAVIWAVPVSFIIVLSVIGSAYFLLLLFVVALFLAITFKNSGKAFVGDFYILQKGFFYTERIFISNDKIERIQAYMTVSARIHKLTYMQIYLSGYRSVIYGGYYLLDDFTEFIEKLKQLS